MPCNYELVLSFLLKFAKQNILSKILELLTKEKHEIENKTKIIKLLKDEAWETERKLSTLRYDKYEPQGKPENSPRKKDQAAIIL